MRQKLFQLCAWILIVAGAFIACGGVLNYLAGRRAQDQIAERWSQDQNPVTETQNQKPAATSTLPIGSTVARLVIPRLQASLYVVEGADDRSLTRGPGHVLGTVLPGEDGNCVIAGHRDTHFRVLKNIRQGDQILLDRHGKQFRYRVDGMAVVTPDNTSSLQRSSNAVLNLITCYPFYFVGSAPKRFIVHASLESAPLAARK